MADKEEQNAAETAAEESANLEEEVGNEEVVAEEAETETAESEQDRGSAEGESVEQPAVPTGSPENLALLQSLQQQVAQLAHVVQQQHTAPATRPPAPEPPELDNWDGLTPRQLASYVQQQAAQQTAQQISGVQAWAYQQLLTLGNVLKAVAADNPKYQDAAQAAALMQQTPGLQFEGALAQVKVDKLAKENARLQGLIRKAQKHTEKRVVQAAQVQKPKPGPPVVPKYQPNMTKDEAYQIFLKNLRERGVNPDTLGT